MQNLIGYFFATPVVAQQAPAPGGGGLKTFLPFILMIAAMYFLLIAPQRKKQKEHQKLVAALATGDEILTSGGIYGTVTNVKGDRLVVRIGEGTKVEIARSFVQSVEKKSSSGEG